MAEMDSTGKPIKKGSKVKFRGQEYTIYWSNYTKNIGEKYGIFEQEREI